MRINQASPAKSWPLTVSKKTDFTLRSLGGIRHQGILLYYDPGCFYTQLFEDCGIAVPASVARSVRKRQADFFHGRLASRCAMQSLGMAEHSDIGIGAQRQPLWPEGVTGSISHTQGIAAAVVGCATEAKHIGIDLEYLVTPEAASALNRLVVDRTERALLDSVFPGQSSLGLTITFSAKESFFKAAFPQVGQYFDFGAITLQEADTAERSLQFALTTRLTSLLPVGQSILAHYDLISPSLVMTHVYC